MSDRIHELVTERIIAKLEEGVAPWHRPWRGGLAPLSMSSGKPYRGINILLLALAAEDGNFTSNWWGSYKQIQKLGGQVRKGEKSTIVVFWKRLVVEEEVDGQKVRKTIPLLRFFRTFNADQCDGLPEKYQGATASVGTFAERQDAEQILKGYLSREGAPVVRHGGDEAYYLDFRNAIHLPRRESFETADSYYGTAFHEVTHSTGSPRRLGRPGIVDFDHFGSERYAKEELVAEMGSAILQAVTGIEAPFDNSAAYVANWLTQLRNDKKLVVTAAAQAQRAVDHILGVEYGADES